jgi:hypothetical protein
MWLGGHSVLPWLLSHGWDHFDALVFSLIWLPLKGSFHIRKKIKKNDEEERWLMHF